MSFAPGSPSSRLTRIGHRAFGRSGPYVTNTGLREYFTDMLGQYGIAHRESRYAAGNRNTFVAMADALVATMEPLGELDLIVLAYAVADCDPRKSTAAHLTRACAGDPLAFAVSDQGCLAPFTALRIARGYADIHHRALIVVLDQSTTGYAASEPDGPRPDHAVGLLLERDGAVRVDGPRSYAADRPAEIHDALVEELGDAASRTTMVVGAGIDPERDVPSPTRRVHPADRRRPCAGVWTELAEGLAHWTTPGERVVAVDYDPAVRRLAVLTLDREEESSCR